MVIASTAVPTTLPRLVRFAMPVLASMIDTNVLIVPSPRWSS